MRFTATLPSGVRPKINEFWKYNSRKDEALFFWNEDKKCYRFSLGRVEKAAYVDGGVKLVAGEYVEHGGLSGTASKLDRTMVYPCVRLRRQVPCPCATCRRFSVPRVNKAPDMHNVKDFLRSTSPEEEGPDVKTQLNTDMVEVSNNQYECEQCTYKTTRKFDLKHHKIKKHLTENTLDI